MRRLKIWASEEDQLLIRVSSAAHGKWWKQASLELKKRGFDRAESECRQRFVNHLDPSVNKQLWSEEELETLYSKYGEYGNKWFLIQKHLPGRTQTKIKNYFYGNIRQLLKLILRFFLRCSTGFINDIRTETLLNIYESQDEYEGMGIVPKTIKWLGFRVEQAPCDRIISQNRQYFYQFLRVFLQASKSKLTICLKNLPSQSQSPKDTQNALVVPCEIATRESEGQEGGIEHLRMMAQYHLKCYQFYRSAYAELSEEHT